MDQRRVTSELRQDRTTGRRVIVAPGRRGRPGAQDHPTAASARQLPAYDPDCPFCPGNEARLPGIVAETSAEAAPHWSVRVAPNKFPIVEPDAVEAARDVSHDARAATGAHEVIIESARHDADLAILSDAEIEAVVRAYRDRFRALLDGPGIEAVMLFRNHGARSGASLEHPHAQAVALDLVPPLVRRMAEHGEAHYREHARCPTCEELEIERDLEMRIIEDAPGFIVLVPFAAEWPSETWIVPTRHQACFADLDDAHAAELARVLRRALARLANAHGDPPYNFVIDSADRAHRDAPYVHWRLRIAPDLAVRGGFELGAGLAINPSSPEEDAALLRAARDRREADA